MFIVLSSYLELAKKAGELGVKAVKHTVETMAEIAQEAEMRKIEAEIERESIRSTLPSNMPRDVQDSIIEQELAKRKSQKSAPLGEPPTSVFQAQPPLRPDIPIFKPVPGVDYEMKDEYPYPGYSASSWSSQYQSADYASNPRTTDFRSFDGSSRNGYTSATRPFGQQADSSSNWEDPVAMWARQQYYKEQSETEPWWKVPPYTPPGPQYSAASGGYGGDSWQGDHSTSRDPVYDWAKRKYQEEQRQKDAEEKERQRELEEWQKQLMDEFFADSRQRQREYNEKREMQRAMKAFKRHERAERKAAKK